MEEWFVEVLQHHPEMALFLTLAIGYWIGKVKIGGFTLGAVVGVLIAGVVIGQLGIKISSDLKTAFFLLFLFAIGYRTGPQFFQGLKASGLPQVALTVILTVTALGVACGLARFFGFNAGTAAGLIAGGMTESATVGTATDAINRLALDASAKHSLTANVAVAFAVTYFLGVITTVTVLSRIAPKILGVDLVAECNKLEREMGVVDTEEGTLSGYQSFVARAYRVENDRYAGKSVAELEAELRTAEKRAFVMRIRRGDELIDSRPDTRLRRGDVIALSGRRASVIAEHGEIGPEVDDKPLLDFPVIALDVVITNKEFSGKTLGELAHRDTARGVTLRKITRNNVELPWTLKTEVNRGDVLTLVGHEPDVERVAAIIGYADRPTHMTDMIGVGAAIFIGGMIGIPALAWHGVDIGLSQSVGVLLGGLVFGWLRSVNPRLGKIPEGALWLFDSVGLTAFLACTAIAAGPDFVKGIRESGVSLLIAGILTTTIPLIVTVLIGRTLFKMHPGILLGVCAGASTSAPSLAAVQEVAKSKIPTLGYGVTYAVGNVLLALWGSVMVGLMQAA